MNTQRAKLIVAWLSVFSNIILVALKFIVGLVIGAVSVISEAIHSSVDLIASIIALVAVNTSQKPADEEHPYGHGKVENISGVLEALLIFLAAGWIIDDAIRKLWQHEPIKAAAPGVIVMFISVIVNIIVTAKLAKVGKATDSIALQADAWHHATDIYTSVGVMAGLGVIWIVGEYFPTANLYWIDPIAAIAVAILILKTAWDLTLKSARDLLDVRLPKDEEAWICDYLRRRYPTICGFHHLRTRKAGAYRYVEFHLLVEKDMSVADSHSISDILQSDIEDRFPGTFVTIHIEPCDGRCKPSCASGCLLTKEERNNARKSAVKSA